MTNEELIAAIAAAKASIETLKEAKRIQALRESKTETPEPKAEVPAAEAVPDTGKIEAVSKLRNFLSEFSFWREGVSMRMVNTIARCVDKKAYVLAYAQVGGMEDLPDLKEKIESPEWGVVEDAFKAVVTEKVVNQRFAVYYGAPGGGKTYSAEAEASRRNGGVFSTMACSPSMDAADMLFAYRLDYETQKKGYVPTALLNAMTEGKTVVLDEINLLPMEARMFLQNILDGKKAVNVMGQELPIKDGFFVLGTMNLETGLGSTPLPLPLIDRAAEIREFKATDEMIAKGAF